MFRVEAITTIGKLGSPSSLDLLRRMTNDSYREPGAEICGGEEGEDCEAWLPIRQTAEDAIAAIEQIEQEWARQAAELAEGGSRGSSDESSDEDTTTETSP